MSKIRRITPYLGMIVLIVSIGGIFYPKLGYILLLVFATLLIIAPRTWCTFCPMGTLQRIMGGSKYQLKLDGDLCIDCKRCQKVCPMQLRVFELQDLPDCIKCGRCVDACPKDALIFH